ncbi:MAG TPA: class I SAM-dependent methyltransferase [Solirubrobacteraceae bacterium]|jgi:hypothetical protein|nr:class I SAM-dependent methyltransferase [Solirubrobacteraceae bacterium]
MQPQPPVDPTRGAQRSSAYRRLRRRAGTLRRRFAGTPAANRPDANHAHRDALLARLPKGGVGLEIGTWKGDFSARILADARPRRLYLVDPWEHRGEREYSGALYGGNVGEQERMDAIHEGVCGRFEAEIERGQVVVLRASSLDAAAELRDGALDWVYIDGDHTHAAVRRDLDAYYDKLKPDGMLAGDDYGVVEWWDDGVTRAVEELAASGRCGGPEIFGSQFLFTKRTPSRDA